MIVLVTGGRDYTDADAVDTVLSAVHHRFTIDLLAHGDADGADRLCAKWARHRGIKVRDYPVVRSEWERYGGRAGNLRNTRMFVATRPDIVIAFPGHDGTFHMTTVAKRHNTPILYVQEYLKGHTTLEIFSSIRIQPPN